MFAALTSAVSVAPGVMFNAPFSGFSNSNKLWHTAVLEQVGLPIAETMSTDWETAVAGFAGGGAGVSRYEIERRHPDRGCGVGG